MPRENILDRVDILIRQVEGQEDSLKGTRDRAIVLLLATEGLKANELIQLEWRDLYLGQDLVTLSVRGARGRVLTVGTPAAMAVRAYWGRYAAVGQTRKKEGATEKMFVAFQGRDGETPLPQITRHGLKFLIYELGEHAGIPHCNTELLRHFAISHQLEQGRDPEEIMHRLGLRRLGLIAKHAGKKRTQVAP